MPNNDSVTLSFDHIGPFDGDTKLGNYQTFIDELSATAGSIGLTPPAGLTPTAAPWVIKGANLYPATESTDANGRAYYTPNNDKIADIAALRTLSRTDDNAWRTVFTSKGFADGNIGFILGDDGTGTITDSGTTPGVYEYLIWIQGPASEGSLSDFVDPGIRNRGP